MKEKTIPRKEYIKKGIKIYKKEMEELIDVIRQYGGNLTQDEFDCEFNEYQYVDNRNEGGSTRRRVLINEKHRFGVRALTEESFFLGGMFQSEWSKWLELLQLMCEIGEVRLKETAKGIVYCIP